MIELNTKHPDFDMAMELLCLLPKYPTRASRATIRSDLDIAHLTPHIRRVIADDHALMTTYTLDECYYSIHAMGWRNTQEACQEYYNNVYGEKDEQH